MVPQRPPSGASSWLRFDLNQCVVLSVFRRVGADEAAMVEDEHGRHAAFDPDSARRLCCCRDRRRAFVFGWGNDLSVDVAEARSSPLTNEQQPLRNVVCELSAPPADSTDITAGATRIAPANVQAANPPLVFDRCRTGFVRQPKPVRKTPDEL